MKIFAVKDRALLGRGIFALFSTLEKAQCFLAESDGIVQLCGEVTEMAVLWATDSPSTVFAAYTYDDLYDCLILDGLYENHALARDVAGNKGLVVELLLDSEQQPRIVMT